MLVFCEVKVIDDIGIEEVPPKLGVRENTYFPVREVTLWYLAEVVMEISTFSEMWFWDSGDKLDFFSGI